MAITQDWQFQIGTLLMGPGTKYGVQAAAGLKGISSIRSSDTPRPLADGVTFGRDLKGERNVSLAIVIYLTTGASDAVSTLDTLIRAWNLENAEAGVIQPLSFQLPGQPTQRLNGRPRVLNPDLSLLPTGRARVALEYVASDPRIYADSLSSVNVLLPTSGGGFTFPLTFPLSFGGGTVGTQTATNAGTVSTLPVATIYGPVTNPQLENLTTGEILKVNIVLSATDYLVIDFDAKTVLLGGTASRYSLLDQSSVWWDLAPGDNQIRFQASTYSVDAHATLSWRSAWL